MGRPNKGQHKVPRTYLEAFTDDNGHVWNADLKLKLFPLKPLHTLTEKDYYTIKFGSKGGTLNIETRVLGGIETAYAEIYTQKLKERLSISPEEKAKLALFVASMLARQPNKRKSLEKIFADVTEKVDHLNAIPPEKRKNFPSILEPTNASSIPAEEFLEAGKDVGSLHSSMIPGSIADVAPIIFEMKWLFLIRSLGSPPFLTSDNPCVMANPVLESHYGENGFYSSPGLAQEHVEITLPLSKDIALICRWESEKDCIYGTLQDFDSIINKRTLRRAGTLIGSDKSMLEGIIESVKIKKEKRELSGKQLT